MNKNFLAFILAMTGIVFVFLLFLAAINNVFNSDPDPSSIQAVPTPTSTTQEALVYPDPPVNLDGRWKMENGTTEFDMIATVDQGSIRIEFNNESTHFLYWEGSFNVTNPNLIMSYGNKEAMDASIMGSQSNTKLFSYQNDKLEFDLTIQGATRTIYLVKEK